MRYLWQVHLSPKIQAILEFLPFVIVGIVLWRAEHKGWALASWVGGGSIVLGIYRIVTGTADYLDQWIDVLYWNKRRDKEEPEVVEPAEHFRE